MYVGSTKCRPMVILSKLFRNAISTTHSCVGGMIGMAWALGGSNCVIWYAPLSTFPYIGGVGGIVLSWFFSPILSAIIASSLFYGMRLVVLRKMIMRIQQEFMYCIQY